MFSPDDGDDEYDFYLKKTADLSGQVLMADGITPAAAMVLMPNSSQYALMHNGRVQRNGRSESTETDPNGRFEFSPTDANYMFVALNDSGFAEISKEDFKKSQKIILQPGEEKVFTRKFNVNDLAFFDENVMKWVVESGEYKLLVGSSSCDIRLSTTFFVE